MANSKPKQRAQSHKGKQINPFQSNGKSSSIVKGIYTYTKPKKTNRIGKNCINFVADKLVCKLDNHLCQNASSCGHFKFINKESNTKQKTNNIKPIKPKLHRKPTDDITHVGVTAIVLSDNRKCTNGKHELKDVNAKIRVVTPIGDVQTVNILAAYCFDCNSYFVLKRDFKTAKEVGRILCPVIDMTAKSNGENNYKPNKGYVGESRIHQMGYNVRKGNDLTTEQRHILIANMLENTNISKQEILSSITRPMLQHQNQPNYANAVNAWKEDIDFVKNYKLGDIPEVIINRIEIGRR